MPAVMRRSRTYPTAPADAFATVLPMPLTEMFRRWYGPLPPIREVRDGPAVWGSVGDTRQVLLTGGGSMHEELLHVERPSAFGYLLTGFTGPFRGVAREVAGLWTFEPAGTGVRISWQWSVTPPSPLAAPLMPAFGRLWGGYARQALDDLEHALV